ncbi:hypothetical protein PYCCODRAFT_130373 [Trametes coccinea BRFM310]|uniref:Uncharacterized protein n=1 Tax=Trametes coccinea (strain BRFM310) TaxID=1353009 RepID=A0A1Y2IST7_TRAC3|nr:hypothetical protein PYCCODRAFT_130373 [Trametes coccinea BRFM310]
MILGTETSALSCDVIDNSDPHILYEGSWTQVIGSAADYRSTLAFSNESQATATFQFTGTSVAVYGAIKPVGTWHMASTYLLDALPSGAYEPPSVVPSEQHHVLFYASGQLANGPHTLVIENMGEQFWLDYIVVGGQGDGLAVSCSATASLSSSQPAVSAPSPSRSVDRQSVPSGRNSSSSVMQASSVSLASVTASSMNASSAASGTTSKSNDARPPAIVTRLPRP